MAETVMMRGYNGNLSLSTKGITIERGVKARIVRHRWSAPLKVPCDAIQQIWFQATSRNRWGWPGYVQLRLEPESLDDPDYVSRVRDDRTVTFLSRSDEWRSLAEAIAQRSGARLREFPAEASSWRSAASLVNGSRRRRDSDWRT
jgi:hypothetical protein